MAKRLLPILATFVLTTIALLPSALSLTQHGDEAQYGWSAGYFGGKIARLDFKPIGPDQFTDPGWNPLAYWSHTQPMGARFLFAIALAVSGSAPPDRPYSYTDPALQGPETYLEPHGLLALRLTAMLCAALGLALIAYRFRWPAFVAAAVFLALPFVRDDLARAWAEGPLLLGFGLCVATYGSRWFAISCGIAPTFKITALVLWPFAFHQGFGNSRFKHIAGFFVAVAAWTVLTPPSWFIGGPVYVVSMIADRYLEYTGQVATYGGHSGFSVPTRYFWPLELAALLVLCIALPRLRLRFAH